MREPESSAPRRAAINVMQMAQGCNDASRGERAPCMPPRDYVEIILWSGRSPWLRLAADGRFLQSLRRKPPNCRVRATQACLRAAGPNGAESRPQTIPVGFARKPEPQPCRLFAKGTRDDSSATKTPEELFRAGGPRQAEQGSAADNLNVQLRQHPIEPFRRVRQPLACGIHPGRVRERPLADGDRGPRYRPRTETGTQCGGEMRCGEREAQPQSRETKELAEGPQHDDVAAVGLAGEAILRRADIHERFVDDEQPVTVFQLPHQCEQPVLGDDPPIRIVGIGDYGEIGVAKLLDICCFCYFMSGKAGGARMF